MKVLNPKLLAKIKAARQCHIHNKIIAAKYGLARTTVATYTSNGRLDKIVPDPEFLRIYESLWAGEFPPETSCTAELKAWCIRQTAEGNLITSERAANELKRSRDQCSRRILKLFKTHFLEIVGSRQNGKFVRYRVVRAEMPNGRYYTDADIVIDE